MLVTSSPIFVANKKINFRYNFVAPLKGKQNASPKLTSKTKWYHSCGCSDDSWSYEQLKKRVPDKSFEKKLGIECESYSVTGKVYYHYNSWVTGVSIAYMCDRNSGGKTSQIQWLFESNWWSFGCFKCPTVICLPLDPSCKGNTLTRVGLVLQAQFVTWRPK